MDSQAFDQLELAQPRPAMPLAGPQPRRGFGSILMALTLSVAVAGVVWQQAPYDGDSEYYLAMAQGKTVSKPFANRILYPWVVKQVAAVTGQPIENAFRFTALAALLAVAFALNRTLAVRASNLPTALPFFLVVFSPLFIQMAREYFLPDLFYTALLAVLFLLQPKKALPIAALCFLLQVTRDNTLLLVLCAVVVGIVKKSKSLALGALAGSIAGVIVTAFVVTSANRHDMFAGSYILLKIPFNFLRNVFGIPLWTKTLNFCQPWVVVNLPPWLHLGSIRTVGVCPAYHVPQMLSLWSVVSLFGALPLLVIGCVLRFRRTLLRMCTSWELIILAYGLTSFLAGVCTGASIYRLTGYAWPAFWLGGPVLLSRLYPANRTAVWLLLAVNGLILWLPYAAQRTIRPEEAGTWLGIGCVLALYPLALPLVFRIRLSEAMALTPSDSQT